MDSSIWRIARSTIVWLTCISLTVYMLNPGRGQAEILPDNLQFFGNLDELVATVILISGLRYFGLDVARFFAKGPGE
ncbi:MAG: DUF1232 domain-containing protein [Planctomycetes bacterium]|nr:DUF1232 domain-containing protein [Planctomycetota bacterium]